MNVDPVEAPDGQFWWEQESPVSSSGLVPRNPRVSTLTPVGCGMATLPWIPLALQAADYICSKNK